MTRFGLLALLLLGACTQKDDAAEIARQLDLYETYMRANNYFGIASLFAEDGVMAPGVKGPKAIQQQLASSSALKTVEYSIDPEPPVITGNVATQKVIFQQQVRTPQGITTQLNGRIAIQWVRAASGRWLIASLATS